MSKAAIVLQSRIMGSFQLNSPFSALFSYICSFINPYQPQFSLIQQTSYPMQVAIVFHGHNVTGEITLVK